MTNTLRSIAALLTPVLVLACTLLSACTPMQAARTATRLIEGHAPAVTAAQVQRAALAAIAKADAAQSERECDARAERDSDLWWDCLIEQNDMRCTEHGWCSDDTATLSMIAEANRAGVQ